MGLMVGEPWGCTVHDMATKTYRAWDRVPMSWEEYEELGDAVRGDYIDGELVVAAFPSKPHQQMARRLANVIEAALPDGHEVVEGWGWKPGADEFGPDVIVLEASPETVRYTGRPHLVVEILSTDPATDLLRKAAKYAAAGLERYWIIDPAEGPKLVVFRLVDGVFVEQSRHRPGEMARLDIGPTQIAFDPVDLLG